MFMNKETGEAISEIIFTLTCAIIVLNYFTGIFK